MSIKNNKQAGSIGPAQTNRQQKAVETPQANTPEATESLHETRTSNDGFETNAEQLHLQQIEKLMAESSAQPSVIETLNRLLTEKQTQLLEEYGGLNTNAQNIASTLSADGFSEAAMRDKKAELTDLRSQMGELRKRLHAIHRRLQISSSEVAGTPELNFLQRFEPHLKAFASMEQGVERALTFLDLSAQLQNGSSAAEHPGVNRLSIPKDVNRSELGDYLAEIAPSAQLAQAAAALLEEGKPAEMGPPSALRPSTEQMHQTILQGEGAPSSVDGLAQFHEAQKLGSE